MFEKWILLWCAELLVTVAAAAVIGTLVFVIAWAQERNRRCKRITK